MFRAVIEQGLPLVTAAGGGNRSCAGPVCEVSGRFNAAASPFDIRFQGVLLS
jgi:hypothetical protein